MELKDMEAIGNFTNHKFVIKMMDPKDWIRHYNEGGQVVNDFILPRGPRQKDEFSDTVYHAGSTVPCHWHKRGYEIFEIARGSVDCVMDGKRFIAKAGDLLVIPPYVSHGFVFLEEGTIWRELFQEIDMSGGIFEKNMVNNYFPELKEDPDFMAMYREGKTIPREVPAAWNTEPIDHTQIHFCRTPDFAWDKREGDGWAIQLKVGHWETGGTKEIWHADLKKGLTVEYKYPHTGYDLFYVQKGKLELTVYGTHEGDTPMTWIVEEETIIDIPPYHTYQIKVLEDTAMYNYGGEYYLKNCLEDLDSIQLHDPQRLADKKDYLAFLRKHGVYATDIRFEKE